MSEHDEPNRMTLSGHIDELRVRLIRSLAATAVGFVVCFYFIDEVFGFLRKPLTDVIDAWPEELRDRVELIQTEPGEAFFTSMLVALFAGLIVAAPIVMNQIWGFVAAGLYSHERRMVKYYALPGFGLFLAGAALAYYFVLPFALDFLLLWGVEEQGLGIKAFLKINSYISLIAWAMFVFGLVFQLPVIMVFLMRLGVVEPATFKRWRRAVIVINFAAAMVLTPPDVISQIVLAICMSVLYEGAILVGGVVAAPRQEKE